MKLHPLIAVGMVAVLAGGQAFAAKPVPSNRRMTKPAKVRPTKPSIVNINRSNAAQISASIKGIGLKRAAAIVAYRTKNGRFKSLDDLTKVKGISQRFIDKNRAALKKVVRLS